MSPFPYHLLNEERTQVFAFSWERQPTDVYSIPGSDAFFPCTYTGVTAQLHPQWLYNGQLFLSNNPPPGHCYNGTGIIVENIDQSMHLSTYQCIFDLVIGYFESSTGRLFITLTLPEESMLM